MATETIHQPKHKRLFALMTTIPPRYPKDFNNVTVCQTISNCGLFLKAVGSCSCNANVPCQIICRMKTERAASESGRTLCRRKWTHVVQRNQQFSMTCGYRTGLFARKLLGPTLRDVFGHDSRGLRFCFVNEQVVDVLYMYSCK